MTKDTDDIFLAHSELERSIDRLRLMASAPDDVVPEERHRQALQVEVAALARELDDHFRFEERDGYMKGVAEKHPHLEKEVATLGAQHVELRRKLEKLLHPGMQPLDAFRLALLEFVDDLVRHEQNENALLQRYVMEELGTGD